MDIGVAMILLAYAVGSWPLFVSGFATIIIGIFGPMTLAFIPVSILERRQKGRWHKEDTSSLIKAISRTFPIGFVIAMLLLGLMPVSGESSNIGRLANSFILAIVMGILMWIAFRFVMNDLKKTHHEMEKKFDLPFEDAMNAAENLVRRVGGSVGKVERNLLLGKAMRAEFVTEFGAFRIRRIPPNKTIIEIQESLHWRDLANLFDEAAVKLQPKR